jgi:predicted AAA+ superfamily ATPase
MLAQLLARLYSGRPCRCRPGGREALRRERQVVSTLLRVFPLLYSELSGSGDTLWLGMRLVPRHIESEVRDVLASSRAGAILGPRQAGKSTLAKELQRSGLVPNYYNLDEEATRRAARSDPDGFVADIAKPAVIDEIQRAPDLLLAIKQALDASDKRGQFLITGSANVLASRAVADALPGPRRVRKPLAALPG